MDASLVLTKPAPPPTTTASTPASEPEHAEDDFAAHLPPEEAPPPSTRKPTARGARTNEDTTTDADAKSGDKASEDVATLAAPSAPVLIRPQNSVVIFDLSAVIAQGPGDPATRGATAPSPVNAAAATPDKKAPPGIQTPAAALATGAPASPDAVAENAKATSAQAPEAAPATLAPKALESIALPGVAPAHAEARVLPKLRAGRAEAAGETTADVKATPYTGIAASSPAKGAAKVETAIAVQATVAPIASRDSPASTDAAPVADAAPAEQRAHRLNDAAGVAGHRATTPTAIVAQHVIRRFEGRSTSIDVRLDPAELGRVQVSLEVAADNKVTAVVAAENPATLADLVRSARELERALQDAGLELTSGGLSFDLAERGDNTTSDEKSADGHGPGRGESPRENTAPPPSRPFGLESWRGARIDVMV